MNHPLPLAQGSAPDLAEYDLVLWDFVADDLRFALRDVTASIRQIRSQTHWSANALKGLKRRRAQLQQMLTKALKEGLTEQDRKHCFDLLNNPLSEPSA